MQTLSEIHDIDETGSEWLDLREAMNELNRQKHQEMRRATLREKRIAKACKLFAEFKSKFMQGKFQF